MRIRLLLEEPIHPTVEIVARSRRVMGQDIIIYCDGLCEPVNPGGTATYGFVVYRKGRKLKEGLGIIGEGSGMTNNVAEYTAAIEGLRYLKRRRLHRKKIMVKSDSQLLINQLNGSWQVRSARIRPLYEKAQRLLRNFPRISFRWIPREENDEADLLSRQAYMGEAQKSREVGARKIKKEEVKVFPDHYEVRGYWLPKDVSSCTCPDWQKRCRKWGMLCKHQIFVLKGKAKTR